MLANEQVVTRFFAFKKDRPLRIDHELEIGLRDFAEDRLAIDADEDRRTEGRKNFRRFVLQFNAGGWHSFFRNAGNQTVKRYVDRLRDELFYLRFHLLRDRWVDGRKMRAGNLRIINEDKRVCVVDHGG